MRQSYVRLHAEQAAREKGKTVRAPFAKRTQTVDASFSSLRKALFNYLKDRNLITDLGDSAGPTLSSAAYSHSQHVHAYMLYRVLLQYEEMGQAQQDTELARQNTLTLLTILAQRAQAQKSIFETRALKNLLSGYSTLFPGGVGNRPATYSAKIGALPLVLTYRGILGNIEAARPAKKPSLWRRLFSKVQENRTVQTWFPFAFSKLQYRQMCAQKIVGGDDQELEKIMRYKENTLDKSLSEARQEAVQNKTYFVDFEQDIKRFRELSVLELTQGMHDLEAQITALESAWSKLQDTHLPKVRKQLFESFNLSQEGYRAQFRKQQFTLYRAYLKNFPNLSNISEKQLQDWLGAKVEQRTVEHSRFEALDRINTNFKAIQQTWDQFKALIIVPKLPEERIDCLDEYEELDNAWRTLNALLTEAHDGLLLSIDLKRILEPYHHRRKNLLMSALQTLSSGYQRAFLDKHAQHRPAHEKEAELLYVLRNADKFSICVDELEHSLDQFEQATHQHKRHLRKDQTYRTNYEAVRSCWETVKAFELNDSLWIATEKDHAAYQARYLSCFLNHCLVIRGVTISTGKQKALVALAMTQPNLDKKAWLADQVDTFITQNAQLRRYNKLVKRIEQFLKSSKPKNCDMVQLASLFRELDESWRERYLGSDIMLLSSGYDETAHQDVRERLIGTARRRLKGYRSISLPAEVEGYLGGLLSFKAALDDFEQRCEEASSGGEAESSNLNAIRSNLFQDSWQVLEEFRSQFGELIFAQCGTFYEQVKHQYDEVCEKFEAPRPLERCEIVLKDDVDARELFDGSFDGSFDEPFEEIADDTHFKLKADFVRWKTELYLALAEPDFELFSKTFDAFCGAEDASDYEPLFSVHKDRESLLGALKGVLLHRYAHILEDDQRVELEKKCVSLETAYTLKREFEIISQRQMLFKEYDSILTQDMRGQITAECDSIDRIAKFKSQLRNLWTQRRTQFFAFKNKDEGFQQFFSRKHEKQVEAVPFTQSPVVVFSLLNDLQKRRQAEIERYENEAGNIFKIAFSATVDRYLKGLVEWYRTQLLDVVSQLQSDSSGKLEALMNLEQAIQTAKTLDDLKVQHENVCHEFPSALESTTATGAGERTPGISESCAAFFAHRTVCVPSEFAGLGLSFKQEPISLAC